jgi:tetratricopeptide (TPR) repeat protein
MTVRITTFFAILVLASCPANGDSIADQVPDGKAAAEIRESLRCLERGEAADEQKQKLFWYSKGRALAEEALQKDDDSSDAHFALFANWGRIAVIEGLLWNAPNLPTIRSHLDRALELEPDHAEAVAAKGALYLNLPSYLGGDMEKAEPYLVRAIRLDPQSAGTRLELAGYYLKMNRREEAAAQAEAALAIAQSEGKTHYTRRARDVLDQLAPAVREASFTGR